MVSAALPPLSVSDSPWPPPTTTIVVTVARLPGPDVCAPVLKPMAWAAAFEVTMLPAPESKVRAVAVPDILVAAPASSVKVSVPPTRFNVASARRPSRGSSHSRKLRGALARRRRNQKDLDVSLTHSRHQLAT